VSYVSFGIAFKKFLEKNEEKWDIFHFHLPSGLGPLLFSRDISAKTLVTVHTTYKGYHEFLYKKCPLNYLSWNEKIFKFGLIHFSILLEKLALRNCKRIIAVADCVKYELEQWYGQKNVLVIRKGIDVNKLQEHKEMENSVPRILYVGRLVGQKGIFLGINALAMIKKDFIFTVAGTGVLEQKLKDYCRKRGINAVFLGFVEERKLYQLYADSDILLMPSFYETEPLVAMEAAGSGLPIVAFRGARIENIVGEENRRLIVETGNVKALSDVIDYLLENESIRRKIGAENRENVLKNYNIERIAKEYIKIYSKILET